MGTAAEALEELCSPACFANGLLSLFYYTIFNQLPSGGFIHSKRDPPISIPIKKTPHRFAYKVKMIGAFPQLNFPLSESLYLVSSQQKTNRDSSRLW